MQFGKTAVKFDSLWFRKRQNILSFWKFLLVLWFEIFWVENVQNSKFRTSRTANYVSLKCIGNCRKGNTITDEWKARLYDDILEHNICGLGLGLGGLVPSSNTGTLEVNSLSNPPSKRNLEVNSNHTCFIIAYWKQNSGYRPPSRNRILLCSKYRGEK